MDLHRGTQRTCRGCVSLLPPGGPGGSYSLVASMVLSEVPSFFLLSLFKLHYRLHSSIAERGQNTAPSRSGRGGPSPQKFGALTTPKKRAAPAPPPVLASGRCPPRPFDIS